MLDLPFSCTRDCTSVLVDGTRYVYIETTITQSIGSSHFGDGEDLVGIYDGERWHRLNPAKYIEGAAEEWNILLSESTS
jgi:hypothetical protein